MRRILKSLRAGARLNLAAAICLAIGAAATTAVVTLVGATLARPLPFPEADRLVRLWFADDSNPRIPFSVPDARDASALSAFDAFLIVARMRVVALLDTGAERLRGEAVSPGYFETLGVRAALGRTLADSDAPAGVSRVAVLSHRIWRTRFASRPDVIGSTLTTQRSAYTIVGVAPDSFHGSVEDDIVDFWIPLNQYEPAATLADRTSRPAWIVARLAAGQTAAAAAAKAASLGATIVEQHPETLRGLRLRVEPLGENWRGDLRGGARLLVGAALLLLVVAAVNVGGLMASRVIDRRRDLAVCAALGAGRGRVARELLIETAIVAAAGGALGALAAEPLLTFFLSLSPVVLPPYVTVTADWRVMAGASIALVAAAIGAGTIPALLGRRVAPADVLRDGSRGQIGGSSRLGGWLVAGECSLTVVLLVAGALLLGSWAGLQRTVLGYRVERFARLALTISPEDARTPQQIATLYERIRTELSRAAGVERVGLIWPTLPPWDDFRARVRFAGMDPQMAERGRDVSGHTVDGFILNALEIPIVAGRGISSGDGPSSHAAVVSRALAERMGGVEAALGRTIDLIPQADAALPTGSFTIVGVAGDVAFDGIGEQGTRRYIHYGQPGDPRGTREDVYLPLAAFPERTISIGVATTGPAGPMIEPLRRRLASLAPRSAVHWTGTMAGEVALEYAPSRFYAALVTAFSASALVLTAFGLLAVQAHAVRRRTPEIGLRVALGARPVDVARLVLGRGLAPVAIGIALGGAAALGAAPMVRRLLHDVSPFDPRAYVTAGAVLAAAGVVAALLPAVRALAISPLDALRDS